MIVSRPASPAVPRLLSALAVCFALFSLGVTGVGCGGSEDPVQGGDGPSAGVKSGSPSKGGDPVAKGAGEQPANDGPFQIPGDPEAGKKVALKKCKLCHKIDGKGMAIGPAMDKKYRRFLKAKMEEYPEYIGYLKKNNKDIYEARQDIIDDIVATEDMDHRLYKWLKVYIGRPTFDRKSSKMKPVTLTPNQLEDVIAFLFSLPE
ncbi:MAG: c-type cytochrome [Planctomycetota bacterium]